MSTAGRSRCAAGRVGVRGGLGMMDAPAREPARFGGRKSARPAIGAAGNAASVEVVR
jgi:hypothetical protein